MSGSPTPADEVQEANAADRWEYNPLLGSADGFCDPLCSWGPGPAGRTANREFSTAQLFWYVNTFRDHLAEPPIGFTSSSGGFEAGPDRVLAQSLDDALEPKPAPSGNASMLTLPDGQGARLEVQLFSFSLGGTKRYDGSHDAGLVYHEYAHALTDRLIGNLSGVQGNALAEGFSDFYALDFLVATQPIGVADTSTPGDVKFGRWLGELRTQGLDCAVGAPAAGCLNAGLAGDGGYDYGDFGSVDGGPEPHADGEIWAQTLWSIRGAITGADKLARVRRYVTDGVRLAPDFPSFLDMRNAILQAAFSATRDQDLTTLWQVFASRGMGWSARTTGADDTAPVAAFDMPPPPVVSPSPTPPTPTPTPTPTPDPEPVAKITSLSGAKLTSDSRGFFKVKVRFGDAVPAGNARLTVSRKGKRLARAKTPVRLGKTVTKTLRLTKKGRNVIRRGRSKKVTLELRLPNGEKMKKTVKLERKKR